MVVPNLMEYLLNIISFHFTANQYFITKDKKHGLNKRLYINFSAL